MTFDMNDFLMNKLKAYFRRALWRQNHKKAQISYRITREENTSISTRAHIFVYLEHPVTHGHSNETSHSLRFELPLSENMGFEKRIRFGSAIHVKSGTH